jgi:hypothetical protein
VMSQKKDRRSGFDRSEGRNLEDSKRSMREYRDSNSSTRRPVNSDIIRTLRSKDGEIASFDSDSISVRDR